MDEERFNILKIARARDFGISLFYKSLKIYKTATNVIKNINNIRTTAVLPSDDDVKKELDICEKENIKIIYFNDDIYPKYLKNIPNFPIVLSCKGNLDLLKNEKKLAIIGSRNCSLNISNYVKKVSKEVSDCGYVIVSGMAKGVDAAAHYGALKNATIAVLGTGINRVYPKENEFLYHDIAENGLLISEFPYNTAPKPENFPIRNRIIVGLSRGILIASAGVASGTINTARLALDYNREIMVFPGSPYDERSAGSNKLLMDGANMVLNSRGILENLETFMPIFDGEKQLFDKNLKKENNRNLNSEKQSGNYTDNKNLNNKSINSENSKKLNKEKLDEKNLDNSEKENKNSVDEQINEKTGEVISDDTTNKNEVLDIKDAILSKLDFTPIELDDLINELSDYNVGSINSTIMKLRLAGRIEMESGKVFLVKK